MQSGFSATLQYACSSNLEQHFTMFVQSGLRASLYNIYAARTWSSTLQHLCCQDLEQHSTLYIYAVSICSNTLPCCEIRTGNSTCRHLFSQYFKQYSTAFKVHVLLRANSLPPPFTLNGAPELGHCGVYPQNRGQGHARLCQTYDFHCQVTQAKVVVLRSLSSTLLGTANQYLYLLISY